MRQNYIFKESFNKLWFSFYDLCGTHHTLRFGDNCLLEYRITNLNAFGEICCFIVNPSFFSLVICYCFHYLYSFCSLCICYFFIIYTFLFSICICYFFTIYVFFFVWCPNNQSRPEISQLGSWVNLDQRIVEGKHKQIW